MKSPITGKEMLLTRDLDTLVYKKEEFSWGGVYFYKSDKRITELTFEKETDF